MEGRPVSVPRYVEHSNLNEPVKITITIPLQTLIRVEGLARGLKLSRRAALQEAVGHWAVARERSLNRHHRLLVERALQEAKDRAPVEELLRRFRKQMAEVGEASYSQHKDWSEALTGEPPVPKVAAMTIPTESLALRQRREALGLSRESLARLANVSTASIAQFEGGLIPKESRVLTLVQRALLQEERFAA
jgi:DNA-binding XRE family transcriptional regulator